MRRSAAHRARRSVAFAGLRAACFRVALACTAALVGAPASAQTTEHPGLQRAITAYQTGDLTRASTLLDSLPASLPVRDQAVRFLYRGLVQFAFGETARAQTAFARAIDLDPSVRLDPAIHAPSRVRVYLAALDSVVGAWRAQAQQAEAASDWAVAAQRWSRIVAAVPADAVAQERLAAVRARLAPPVAETRLPASAPVTNPAAAGDPRTVPADSAAPAAATRRFDPGQAAALGLLLPGLGQIYAGKPARGVLVLGAAAGALTFGLLHETVSVECLTVPVNNFCPPDDVVSQKAERPYLVPALGLAAALTVIGAIDAFVTASGANRRAAEAGAGGTGASGARLEAPALAATPTSIRLELLRVRF